MMLTGVCQSPQITPVMIYALVSPILSDSIGQRKPRHPASSPSAKSMLMKAPESIAASSIKRNAASVRPRLSAAIWNDAKERSLGKSAKYNTDPAAERAGGKSHAARYALAFCLIIGLHETLIAGILKILWTMRAESIGVNIRMAVAIMYALLPYNPSRSIRIHIVHGMEKAKAR